MVAPNGERAAPTSWTIAPNAAAGLACPFPYEATGAAPNVLPCEGQSTASLNPAQPGSLPRLPRKEGCPSTACRIAPSYPVGTNVGCPITPRRRIAP
jgi:hypothetical protein